MGLPEIERWNEALTAIEDELDTHEQQVRLGETMLVPMWQPPAELGPLPAQYAERVAHLVSRLDLLTTFVQFQLVAVKGDLDYINRRLTRHSAGDKSVAMFLDASA